MLSCPNDCDRNYACYFYLKLVFVLLFYKHFLSHSHINLRNPLDIQKASYFCILYTFFSIFFMLSKILSPKMHFFDFQNLIVNISIFYTMFNTSKNKLLFFFSNYTTTTILA